VSFIINNALDDELRQQDWHGFARQYNGPGYRKNKYAARMASSFARFRFGDVMMHEGLLMTNKHLQRALINHGYLPEGEDDGIVGLRTRAALAKFETDNDLERNGVVDGTEWEALLKEVTHGEK
jgi:lysozyme family protein